MKLTPKNILAIGAAIGIVVWLYSRREVHATVSVDEGGVKITPAKGGATGAVIFDDGDGVLEPK